MQDIVIKPHKKISSPMIYGLLSIAFAVIAVALGCLGLVEKLFEFIFGPFIYAMVLVFMETILPNLGSFIYSMCTIVIMTVHFLATCLGILIEFIPFIVAFISVILAIIAIIKGISKNDRGGLGMGITSISASLISSAILMIPAMLSIGGKGIIIAFYALYIIFPQIIGFLF